jgi:tetratricopeptide (TPR) repeat protein
VKKGPADWLEQARRLHKAGDLEGALGLYRRCLEIRADHPDLLVMAASAAGALGELDEAERLARRSRDIRDDQVSNLTLGRVLLEQGALEEAVRCFEHAADGPAETDAHYHRGRALRRLGRLDEAEQALRLAIGERRADGAVWNELGVVLFVLRKPVDATEAFRRSLTARPGHPNTLSNLGAAYLKSGDQEGAEEAVREALKSTPEHPGALATLGALERLRGRLAPALDAWERCIQSDPGAARGWVGLAGTHQALGRLEEAGEAYRRALDLDPGNEDAVAGMAEWLEWQGRYEEGMALLEDDVSGSPPISLVRARLLRRLDRHDEARRLLEAALPRVEEDLPLHRQFAFSLGDVCDGLGDFDGAWAWYSEGNRLAPAEFDAQAHRRQLGRWDGLSAARPTGHAGQGVIFILGMPRSGTTLVEQVLAAHPLVTACGESPALGRLAHALAAGESSPQTGEQALAEFAREYMASLPASPSGKTRVTDKMPLNYQYLGLIRAALPGARIVHCRRDLRDVGLSCFCTDFIDPELGFSRRSDWIGDYLAAYDRHLQHWREPLGQQMVSLDYESLVEEPETAIRRLLASVDLPWDEGCLRPEEQRRIAATASHAQVRRSIYRSSVGRWRAYAHHLRPMLDRLQRADPGA